MESDVLDALDELGYTGPLIYDGKLSAAMGTPLISAEYSSLVSWLVKQICDFHQFSDYVGSLAADGDVEAANHFQLELSGFLRECGCPYSSLTTGPIHQRIASREAKLLLLDYLITELQAAQIYHSKQPVSQSSSESSLADEPAGAETLKQLLIALGLPKPPDSITCFQLFTKVEIKLKEAVTRLPPEQLSKPLLQGVLSETQWELVNEINEHFQADFGIRREMLLKRLDVTIQSFMWSGKAKTKSSEIASVYPPLRQRMTAQSTVSIAHLLAAREDMMLIEKTSSGASRERTKCAVNKVIIGAVPDRGGRTNEYEPPAPEMPTFKKRQAAPQEQRQGGGGRGGRVQGSWSGRGRGGDRRW